MVWEPFRYGYLKVIIPDDYLELLQDKASGEEMSLFLCSYQHLEILLLGRRMPVLIVLTAIQDCNIIISHMSHFF